MKIVLIEKLLADLIDTTEMMIELAYSSLIYNNKDIAAEVLELEDQVDKQHLLFEIKALMLRRPKGEEKKILGLIRLGLICEMLSDAAASIAELVLRGLETDEILKIAVEQSEDTVSMNRIERGSPLVGKTIGNAKLDDRFNVKILAVKKGKEWSYEPSDSTIMKPRDLIIASGTRESVEAVNKLCTRPRAPEEE